MRSVGNSLAEVNWGRNGQQVPVMDDAKAEGNYSTVCAASNDSRQEGVMALKEKLVDFDDFLFVATDYPPDDYPVWSSWTYETHMADLREVWSAIRTQLKKDVEKVGFIDGKLQEAISAFDAKEKDKGREAILAIYNLNVRKLR